MIRYRLRTIDPTSGIPLIVKHDADDIFTATAMAGRSLAQEGVNLANIKGIVVKPMSAAKASSAVYRGSVRKPRAAGAPKPGTPKVAAVPTPATTATAPKAGAPAPAPKK